MDDIILTFSKKQYEKYLELKSASFVTLEIDTDISIPSLNVNFNHKAALDKALSICDEILNFRKGNGFFNQSLAKEKINELVPSYFSLVNSLKDVQRELYNDACVIVKYVNALDEKDDEVSKKYAELLPYVAALDKDEKHGAKIENIKDQLLNSLSIIHSNKEKANSILAILMKLNEEMIPSFIKKSSQVADSPKFAHLDQSAFFNEITSFTEQIKAIEKQKEM